MRTNISAERAVSQLDRCRIGTWPFHHASRKSAQNHRGALRAICRRERASRASDAPRTRAVFSYALLSGGTGSSRPGGWADTGPNLPREGVRLRKNIRNCGQRRPLIDERTSSELQRCPHLKIESPMPIGNIHRTTKAIIMTAPRLSWKGRLRPTIPVR